MFSGGSAVLAQCEGRDLLAGLGAEKAAALEAATAAQPFAAGNLWQATRGDQRLTILGTYHLADPRHAATMDRVAPMIDAAATVLVEAGPEEERLLMKAMAERPDLLFLSEGGSLIERLPAEDWAMISAAMQARGLPSIMAARMQPWYLSMMLAMPPCAMGEMTARNGLDQLVMDRAKGNDTPVRALEPYDTIFGLFATMSFEDQMEMIRATLAYDAQGMAEDIQETLLQAYFRGEARRMWEFLRIESATLPGYDAARADAEFAQFEEVLMNARNRAWIPVIEAAAVEGPVFVAFGALHLAGREGVLNLLEQAGYTVEQLPL
ncbi:TraB/GumN family protein [Aliigemmobacter aestuarii]|uniref:TraB/GumN family protein n=2 Tax=Aliigemmobacter aestuarii TaxID=1445661 RepID=A0A4S3MW60_9RHOB|nr:TraB/GumN family protein [Gemmobacter aestuarii]